MAIEVDTGNCGTKMSKTIYCVVTTVTSIRALTAWSGGGSGALWRDAAVQLSQIASCDGRVGGGWERSFFTQEQAL